MPIKITTDDFIKRSEIIHNCKYDYSKANYVSTFNKIVIICPEHGIFEQMPTNHLRGKGCKICANEYSAKIRSFTTSNFIKKSEKVHNDKYDYSISRYTGQRSKIKIICKKHGIFEQDPVEHWSGKGCPKCNSSKGERKIAEWLILKNIIFEEQKTFKDCKNNRKLRFDFYLPGENLIIEYDGQQHFLPFSWSSDKTKETKQKNLKIVKQRDKIKNQYCLENSIKLLRISYIKYKDIEKILSNILT